MINLSEIPLTSSVLQNIFGGPETSFLKVNGVQTDSINATNFLIHDSFIIYTASSHENNRPCNYNSQQDTISPSGAVLESQIEYKFVTSWWNIRYVLIPHNVFRNVCIDNC